MTVSRPRLKQVFRDLLADSARKPLPAMTTRTVHGRVHFPGKVSAVVGVRRAGKTTFLHQLRSAKLRDGTSQRLLPFISFEDERLVGLDASDLSLLVDEYRRLHADSAQEAAPVTWHFDEIQLVRGWERFVRRILETDGDDVVVTGSSAGLLSREIATALRGRGWRILLHPFSFEEAQRHRGTKVPVDGSSPTATLRSRMERAYVDWLRTGGFPEAQGLEDPARRQLLRDYVDVAMFRDVVERHDVRNVTGLRWLVRQLLGNAGSLFSVEKFYRSLRSQGIAISKDSVHQMLGYLDDCFLVRVIWMESASERQRMVNPRKAYPVDTGLIPIFDRTGKANLGHALETAVLVELERRGCEITYVRTGEGFEVDFLARGASGEANLIQACIDLSDPATAEREIRALQAAGAAMPEAGKLVLTLTADGFPQEVPEGVSVQTAWEWSLGMPVGA